MSCSLVKLDIGFLTSRNMTFSLFSSLPVSSIKASRQHVLISAFCNYLNMLHLVPEMHLTLICPSSSPLHCSIPGVQLGCHSPLQKPSSFLAEEFCYTDCSMRRRMAPIYCLAQWWTQAVGLQKRGLTK